MTKHASFAQFLKQSRESASLSQKDVSTILGYTSPQFVSNWERGLSSPPIEILKRVAQLYKVHPDEMFKVVLKATIQEVTLNLRRKFYGKKFAG